MRAHSSDHGSRPVIAVCSGECPRALSGGTRFHEFSPLLDVLFSRCARTTVEEPEDDKLLHRRHSGMLEQLDPYSQYFDPTNSASQEKTGGQFCRHRY